MNLIDFPSALNELRSIKQRCEILKRELEETTNSVESIENFLNNFLGTLIGKPQEKKIDQKQDAVQEYDSNNNGSWKSILIADLRQHGKSYTSEINERYCVKKGIVNKEDKKAMLNNIRTMLSNFKEAGFIKKEIDKDGIRKIWYVD